MGVIVLAFVGLFVLIPLLALLGGTVLYWVWPVAMVDVFHLPPLTWWQAVCLTWVCSILIKSTNSNTNEAK